MLTREHLVGYLCAQQHAAFDAAALLEGWETPAKLSVPWAELPPAYKAALRASVASVLDELESLGVLRLVREDVRS